MSGARERAAAPGWWLRGGHLAALWGLAVVQPLFDLLGRNAEFFVARGNGRADILIFSIGLALIPPVAMLALEALVSRASRRAGWGLHLALVGALTALIALQALEGLVDGAGALLAAALLAGALAAFAYERTAAVRSLTSFLIPAPAIFLALFLLASDVSKLVLPQDDADAYAAEGSSDAPVVLVVVDEFTTASLMDAKGGIDERRFPNFAQLARHSTWYRDATTVADHTVEAVPAILTGSRPPSGLEPIASDHPRSLFTLLGGTYRMNVHEKVTQLCPSSICGEDTTAGPLPRRLSALSRDLGVVSGHMILPDSLARGLPPVDEAFSGFGEQAEPDSASGGTRGLPPLLPGLTQEFVRGFDRGRRSFSFLHVVLPHVPWRRLPDGQRHQEVGAAPWLTPDDRWVPSRAATETGFQLHLLQAGYVDSVLGEIIARMRAKGLWRRAVFVVVADHGLSFTPRAPRRFISPRNAGEVAPVPLFVKAPGQRSGRVASGPARTIDVLPIIAEQIGVELPFSVDGRLPAELSGTRQVTVSREGAGPSRFSLAAIKRGRDRLAARKARLFGSNAGWEAVYAAGSKPELVGRLVDSLGVRPGTGSVTIAEPGDFEDVSPNGPFVPSLIQGELEGVPDGAPLAVAVEGRVAATTRAYPSDPGGVAMAAVVSPSRFAEGANDIRMFRIVPARGAEARLVELRRR